MNAHTRNSLDTMNRVALFATERMDLLNEAAKAVLTQLQASIAEIEDLRGTQMSGKGITRGGVKERKQIAKNLRQALRDITKTARVLGRSGNATLQGQLTLPPDKSYAALLGAGEAFIRVFATPATKALFVNRGFPPTFVADLTALVAQFRGATDGKLGGLNKQIAGTRGLTEATRKGIAQVRDLDAILSRQLRQLEAGLLASWTEAAQIARTRTPKKQTPKPKTGPAPVNAANGTTPAPATPAPAVTMPVLTR